MGMRGAMLGALKEKKRSRPTKDLLVSLWTYLRNYKASLIAVSIVILIYTIFSTLSPIIITDAINQLSSFSSLSDWLVLLTIVFAFLSIGVWI